MRDLLALAPLALQDTKQSIREIEAGLGDVTRMRERAQRASQSADFAEGRAAFAQPLSDQASSRERATLLWELSEQLIAGASH